MRILAELAVQLYRLGQRDTARQMWLVAMQQLRQEKAL